ncbi:XRE family transcriptional regulator [Mycobacteroides abscessus]|uniref:helix-turn-helix domain-containing protein n=1 Tax=Mycobacteroides abscessus TaxID=36809 RepID=UPI002103D8D1|nr:XRE family transcriptional regulator [Mycobacteroides abscessus]
MDANIGERVRSSLDKLDPPRSHRAVAQSVGMTPDAFSRSLKGERSFSSIELAKLADELGQDVYWLITGEPDPLRPRLAARHFFDQSSKTHEMPGREQDEAVLMDIALAYRQAYPQDAGYVQSPCLLPTGADEMRDWLKPDFVRPFIDRVEQNLLVDVVRIKEVSTSYTLSIGTRTVIVVPASGSWFYENWCIAHELGHIAAQDLDTDLPTTKRYEHETRANAFAAELLLPSNAMRAEDWVGMPECDLAQWIWDSGVSTSALLNRITALRLGPSDSVTRWSGSGGTFRLLRSAGKDLEGNGSESEHLVAARSLEASKRRFPVSLQEAHMKRIASGELGKETLAWMMGVQSDQLIDIDEPPEPRTVDPGDLAKMLGF